MIMIVSMKYGGLTAIVAKNGHGNFAFAFPPFSDFNIGVLTAVDG